MRQFSREHSTLLSHSSKQSLPRLLYWEVTPCCQRGRNLCWNVQAFRDGHCPCSSQSMSDSGELRLMHSHFDGIHDRVPSLTDKLHTPTQLEALLSCHFEEEWKGHQWPKNAFCGPLLFMLGCSLQELFWNVFALGFEVFQKKNTGWYLRLKYNIRGRKGRILCFIHLSKMQFIVKFLVPYPAVLYLFVEVFDLKQKVRASEGFYLSFSYLTFCCPFPPCQINNREVILSWAKFLIWRKL